MMSSQAHRGPDGSGTWRSPGGDCTLGHNRLAIIDLSTASGQPFVDDESGSALVFNGEIYNYLELRRELSGRWQFKSRGDTEVLFAALQTWGLAALDKLNG